MPHREVRTDRGRAAGSTVATLRVDGAAENNLRDLTVAFGPGLTTVVGVSGSGKSSLIFDVVYHEARRRLLEALALASPWSRVAPARVRRIDGLAPAVAIGLDTVIRNPNSTAQAQSTVARPLKAAGRVSIRRPATFHPNHILPRVPGGSVFRSEHRRATLGSAMTAAPGTGANRGPPAGEPTPLPVNIRRRSPIIAPTRPPGRDTNRDAKRSRLWRAVRRLLAAMQTELLVGATVNGARSPYKRGVAGSNPAAPTHRC